MLDYRVCNQAYCLVCGKCGIRCVNWKKQNKAKSLILLLNLVVLTHLNSSSKPFKWLDFFHKKNLHTVKNTVNVKG